MNEQQMSGEHKQPQLSEEQQARVRRIEAERERQLQKCIKKLEKSKKNINRRQRRLARKRVKCERSAVRKMLKWERMANRIKRNAEKQIAAVTGVEIVAPICRDLDAMERSRMENQRTELENRGRIPADREIPAEQLKKNYPMLYEAFCNCTFLELEQHLREAGGREEKAFYRSMLNLKLQIEQEKVVGEVLL